MQPPRVSNEPQLAAVAIDWIAHLKKCIVVLGFGLDLIAILMPSAVYVNMNDPLIFV
jgi:hypothetical protein